LLRPRIGGKLRPSPSIPQWMAPKFTKPDRRVNAVTFGGGVRYEDTLAPQWPELSGRAIPFLVAKA
jgi:hypothetical protein